MSKQSAKPSPPASSSLSRDQALEAKPMTANIVGRTELPEGGLRLTVPLYATAIQRWLLRVPPTATQQYDLDALGVEVLQMCDGQTPVREMVQRFAKAHQVGVHEAQTAVATFLRTLVRRGVVVMVVEKG